MNKKKEKMQKRKLVGKRQKREKKTEIKRIRLSSEKEKDIKRNFFSFHFKSIPSKLAKDQKKLR